jgi:hypothetical protein
VVYSFTDELCDVRSTRTRGCRPHTRVDAELLATLGGAARRSVVVVPHVSEADYPVGIHGVAQTHTCAHVACYLVGDPIGAIRFATSMGEDSSARSPLPLFSARNL